jgi:hypothetical protein
VERELHRVIRTIAEYEAVTLPTPPQLRQNLTHGSPFANSIAQDAC